MRARLGMALLSGAALMAVGCALPGPVIVVTEPGYVATIGGVAVGTPVTEAPAPVEATTEEPPVDTPNDPFAPPSQLDAVEAQRKTVERRTAALKQGVTRARGRHLVTRAISDAVTNRVGTLESRIAALEAEFERRAERLDATLERLRESLQDAPEAPEAADLPADDPAL